MTGFAGTGQLSRLAFRRDGAVLPTCVVGVAALLAITARDLKVLYPTAAGRLAVATRASANPALRFLLGRLNGTSVGAFLAARWSVWGAAFAVLMTSLALARLARSAPHPEPATQANKRPMRAPEPALQTSVPPVPDEAPGRLPELVGAGSQAA